MIDSGVNPKLVEQYLSAIANNLGTIGRLLAAPLDAALYPAGATPLVGNSGNGANAQVTATLTPASGQTAYLTGFDITSSGSTTAAVVTATVTGTITSIFGYTYGTVAGVLVANTPLIIRPPRPIPASAINTDINVILPALGSGNTRAIIVAYGFSV